MRILILTPTALPSITGNAVTAERWRQSLQRKGIDVKVLATQGLDASDLLSPLQLFRPDLIHVHHAFRGGNLLLDPRIRTLSARIPLVVSPGGTDINLDIERDDRRETVSKIFTLARTIIVQSPETSKQIAALFPDLRKRIALVLKSFFWLGQEPCDPRTIAGCQLGEILFFLPAGIRPVKGPLECLTAFEKIHEARPLVRILFAGPALDLAYAAEFERRLRRCRSFAGWVPSINPRAMRSAYETSDIVLNASFSEGLSNALLEAIAAGRPVLASDIPGNRWPVLGRDGDLAAGCLYRKNDPEDFLRQALRLVDDERLGQALAQACRARSAQWPTPQMEADGLIEIYRAAAMIS
jgi:glycosyltransferase involved in cell wall biosynthesis